MSVDLDIIREIPGYRVILKAVLKNQIKALVEQLSSDTDEESIFVTASISDGTLSHLGSNSGKGFIGKNEELKSQFLSYCLKERHSDEHNEDQSSNKSPSTSGPVKNKRRKTMAAQGANKAKAHSPRSVRMEPYPISKPTRTETYSFVDFDMDGTVIKIEPIKTDYGVGSPSVGDGSHGVRQYENVHRETEDFLDKVDVESCESRTSDELETPSENSSKILHITRRSTLSVQNENIPSIGTGTEQEGDCLGNVDPMKLGEVGDNDVELDIGTLGHSSFAGADMSSLDLSGGASGSTADAQGAEKYRGRYKDRKSPDVFEELPQSAAKRFKSATKEEVTKLREETTEKTTNKQTKWALKILKEWMTEVGHGSVDFATLPLVQMDRLLQQLYAAVRTKDGQDYSKSALVALRAGLNRHLATPPVSRNVNLINDRDFTASNQVLSGLIKGLKRAGKDIVKHKEPIDEEDLNKLYQSGLFSETSPKTLQNKVIFDVISQFGIKRSEGLRDLKQQAFMIKADAKGRRYVSMTSNNEADKNHQGMDHRGIVKELRMYQNGTKFCPVKSFEKYMSKLIPCLDDFFQRPLEEVAEETPCWYGSRAVGVNNLGSFMTRMSKCADLSRTYTNHCIRANVTRK